ncbi:hypothetical protein V8D89_006069 [Ganoderma adspersum]
MSINKSQGQSVKFYNEHNLSFGLEPDAYIIFAMVAQTTASADLCGQPASTWKDYDLVGDIIWLLPASSSDPMMAPMMVISGPASEINWEAGSFRLSANQYVQQLGGIGNIPLYIALSNSPCYKNAKPLPSSDGTNSTVISQLHAIKRTDVDFTPEHFSLHLERVTFFPRSNNYFPSTPSTPTPARTRSGAALLARSQSGGDVPVIISEGKKHAREDDEQDDLGSRPLEKVLSHSSPFSANRPN